MSEYQFVHFLAIDRPLDDEELDFMGRQSSRADISRWEFTNEYHYGDFHGNAREMLRRGYDVHLHYANFGIRRLMVRLPAGLPCDRATFDAFRRGYGLEWVADKQGKGGILEIGPEADPDTYDEMLDDIDVILPEIAPVREALLGGDLQGTLPGVVGLLPRRRGDRAAAAGRARQADAGTGCNGELLRGWRRPVGGRGPWLAARTAGDRHRKGIAEMDHQAVQREPLRACRAAAGQRGGRGSGTHARRGSRRHGRGRLAHGRAVADLGPVAAGCRGTGRPAPAGNRRRKK